ncbi:MAG: DUF262 domain-containing protein [Acholeplasmatales bacterium]|jgi:hypothetical protein|nr:DUF262 domain-containing protein [Acholeplasmatales bacterium]
MSKITNCSISIFEALKYIKEGKYGVPAFQRQYVWDIGRIEKLCDSILLDYPISNFLFWHIDNNNVTWNTYFCKFLSNICFDNSTNPKTANYDIGSIDLGKSDTAILDG